MREPMAEDSGNRRIALRTCIVKLAICVLGCSSPSTPALVQQVVGIDVPACVPMESLLDSWANIECALNAATGVWHRFQTGNCRTEVGWSSLQNVRDRMRLAELGRIQYDCNAASVCLLTATDLGKARNIIYRLTAYWKTSIPDVTVDPACLQVFTGKLTAGADCDDDAECASGLRCWGCPGVCRAPVATGAACGNPTAVCDDTDFCIQNLCVSNPIFTNGQVCDDPAKPHEQVLAEQMPCVAGLSCEPTNASDPWSYWTCATPDPYKADGQLCSGPKQCVGTCANGTCTSDADGKAFTANECVGKPCIPAGAGKKVCWSTSNPKLPCGTTPGCDTGQYCSLINAALACKPLPKPGEPCADSDICDGGLCNATTGLCDPQYTTGCAASCQQYYCHADGTCGGKDLGDDCTTDEECNPWIKTNKCVNGKCRRFGPLNRACPP